MVLLLVVLTAGESDLEALLELKKGIEIQDPSGKILVSWDPKSMAPNRCPQNWFGISCNGDHVVSITLTDLGLIGDFNFSVLTGLTMLQNISIQNNHFTGTISGIELIDSLEYLDLSCNLFHGFISSGLTNLKNLVLLNLSSNSFEGTVPSGFGNLAELKYLDLQGNMFSGDVMLLLSQLGSVVHVDISNNRFSGSLDLGNGNAAFISTIQYFNVSNNSVAGELFAHDGMPYFDSLEVFDASNNQLESTIPAFNFVFSLRILRLGGNRLSGSIPEGLLQENSMILSELDLSLNQLEGPVGSITSETLNKLNLSSNDLSGYLPLKIGRCAIIDLSNNMLSGNFSRILSWGNYVESIQLSSNALTGAFPNQTSQFLRLTSLGLSNNSLEGALPPILGTYPELEVIDLSLNQFSGVLLPSLFASERLTDLNLSCNNFTGSIPLQAIKNTASSGSLQNLSLVSLDLSHNSLTGHLPPEINEFHNLVYLNLANNHFGGSLPDSLPVRLKELNLSYNNLSGVVPENLKRFTFSAFYPGNPLLTFQLSHSSPKDEPNLNLRKHKPSLKPVVRGTVIAVSVIGTAIIVLMSVMIYCRAHEQEAQRKIVKDNGVDNGTDTDQSLSLFKVPQDQASSSIQELGGTSSSRRSKYPALHVKSAKDGEEISSPVSIFSSCNLSPSENQSPSVLLVTSPDKLVGDLHLFNSSFMFTAKDLSLAPVEVIGRSCHGSLYRVELGCGYVLAVKRLRRGVAKGRKEFTREAKKLGNIRHPNLVSLQGYYWGPNEHEKLIISNYINAPCLALYLQQTEHRELLPLSLNERLKVAIDMARCLNYLHNERAIPHGNLKSTNILLGSSNSNALLTDYSLHRLMTQTGTADQVLNAGALGYRPPEFAHSSKPCPSLKSDVYAFGVVLMELLAGRCSGEMAARNAGGFCLSDWVRMLAAENRASECFDRRITGMRDGQPPPTGLDDMLKVALRCVLPASERPDMKTVFDDLLSIML